MKNEQIFFTVSDITGMMGISKSTAYRLIRNLNKELGKKGKLTLSGKVNKGYFRDRVGYIGGINNEDSKIIQK